MNEAIHENCQKALISLKKALACGVIDLKKKEFIHLSTESQFSKNKENEISAKLLDVINGGGRTLLFEMARKHFKVNDGQSVIEKEVQFSFGQWYYFGKTIKNRKYMVVLITGEKINIGMAWVRLKSIIPTMENILK